MARPIKEGLEYFPLDCDMDQNDKVVLIEAQHGVIGFSITIKLLMKIYKCGYFYMWTKKEQLLFSKRINVDVNKVNEIVNDLVEWKFFDERLYEDDEILTSKGIQERYLTATNRRQKVEILQRYLLLDDNSINSYSNLVIVSDNEVSQLINDNIGTQSKVKERKEKNIYSPPEDERNKELIKINSDERITILWKKLVKTYGEKIFNEESDKVVQEEVEGCENHLILLKTVEKRLKRKSKEEQQKQFEEFWAMYPRKEGKAKAMEHIGNILKSIDREELKRAIERYSKTVEGNEKQFILMGSTFFNERYIDYLDCNYQEEDRQGKVSNGINEEDFIE